MENIIQVGFGVGDITPDWPIGLQGLGNHNDRIHTEVLTPISIYCVAITDAKNETALIMTIDAGGGGFCEDIFPPIQEKFGISPERMILSALHQHSTPYGGERYDNLVIKGALEAVEQALNDRAPAAMYLNTVQTHAMNFVRNYVCNDGSFCGPNYGSSKSGIKCHESDADPEMRLIKFVREGKKPVIMVNFQAHPHLGAFGPNLTKLHADWPGIMRDDVADRLDAHCIYFSGAGGNLNSNSAIKEENVSTDWIHHGHRAADYVVGAEGSYKQAQAGALKFKKVTIDYEANHSQDHLLEEATYIHELRQQNFNQAKEEVKNYPNLHSIYHATSIVIKAARPATHPLTIGAIALSDVVFTYHPYEMFDTNGMELRAGTVGNPNYEPEDQLENPYPMTFVCTLGNGHLGYVPSKLGYTNGGYSTDIAYLAPGSGEKLVGDYLAILQELHG